MSQNKRLTLNSTKAALISVIEKAQQNRGFSDLFSIFWTHRKTFESCPFLTNN
jgi:hypothetical protein